MITIERVDTKKQAKEFVSFPLKLYENNPYYVPQLFGDEIKVFNPKNRQTKKYYMEAFLARNEKREVVGRVAALVHQKYNETWKDKRVRFTRIDYIDDYEVSAALIGAVENFAKEHGMTSVCGPLGALDTDREGMLVEGFDLLSTLAENYNYPYYKDHVEKLGYKTEAQWNEKHVIVSDVDHKRFERLSAVVMKRNKFVFSEIKNSKKFVKKYKYEGFRFVNETYSHLYGFVPLDDEDIDGLVKSFNIALKRDYMEIIHDENGETVGFVLAMPSIAKAVQDCKGKLFPFGFIKVLHSIRRPKIMEALLIGVAEKYRNTGITAVLMNYLLQTAKKYNINLVESNIQLLNNKAIQNAFENLSPKVVRLRTAYMKKL